MPTPEPEGSSSREGRHTFSADVSASETPEKTAESNPKSRKPGARALVPAVANKKTGHMQWHKFGLQNQNKSLSRANEGQLHLLGRRLYGTENSPWFRGTRAATEQRLRLNLLGWLRVRLSSCILVAFRICIIQIQLYCLLCTAHVFAHSRAVQRSRWTHLPLLKLSIHFIEFV